MTQKELFAQIAQMIRDSGLRTHINTNDQRITIFAPDGKIGKCYNLTLQEKRFNV